MSEAENKAYNMGVQAAINYVNSNAQDFSSVDHVEDRIFAFPYLTEMAQQMQGLKK